MSNLYSQNRNSIWCFGDSAGINFTNINNPTPFSSSMISRGTCISISDTIGNLLFYANTYSGLAKTIVWNAPNDTMENADTLIGEGFFNELQTIPFPDGSNKYYLFQLGVAGFVDGIYYSIIDMDSSGGLGAVTIKNQQISTNRIADCLQAVQHGNGRDWWLITKLSSSNFTTFNRFIIYLITQSGISSPINFDFTSATDMDFQKIIFNNKCNKVMLMNIRGFMAEYDFDRCNGIIANEHIIFPEQTSNFNRYLWEGSYSANDSVFYCTTVWFQASISDTTRLLQFNLAAPNISASSDTLGFWKRPILPGAVRLAPNNKIYIANQYFTSNVYFPYPDSVYNYINTNLSVINSPDSLGAACNFLPFSFNLGGKRCYSGLPNNPNYELGRLTGSPCDTLTRIKEVEIKKELILFPNPFSDKLNIVALNNQTMEIILYDIASRKLLQQKFRNSISLNTEQIAKGIYIYEVRCGSSLCKKGKLVKD
jgi:hypothetical protein